MTASAESPALPGARGWLALGLLFGVAASNYITRFMLVTMHQSIEASIPMTEAQFGLISSLFLFFYAAVSPLGGYLADRFGRSRVIVIITAVWSAMTGLSALARTFPQLLTMRALMGLSEGCYLPAANGLITDYHRGPTRSLAVGVHLIGTVIGGVAAGLGGWIAERRGWNFAFAAVGISCLGYCLVLAWGLRDVPREAAERRPGPDSTRSFGGTLWDLARNGRFLLAMVYWGLLGAIAYVIASWMPVYLQEHFQLSQGRAGITANCYTFIPQMLGYLLGGIWSDRWSRRNPHARVLVSVIGLAGAIPCFFFAGHSNLLAVTLLTLILWGFGAGFMGANMMPILCLICDPRYRATAFGVLNVASAIGGAVIITWAGHLRDLHVDLGGYLPAVGIGIALSAVLCGLIRPPATAPAAA